MAPPLASIPSVTVTKLFSRMASSSIFRLPETLIRDSLVFPSFSPPPSMVIFRSVASFPAEMLKRNPENPGFLIRMALVLSRLTSPSTGTVSTT